MNYMVLEGREELDTLLAGRLARTERTQLLNILEQAAEGLIGNDTEQALQTVLQALCPPPCKEINAEFWDTPVGQFVAMAQYNLYQRAVITKAEASRILFGDSSQRHMMTIERRVWSGKLRVIRKPDTAFRLRRKNRTIAHSGGTWLVFREDVERLKTETP